MNGTADAQADAGRNAPTAAMRAYPRIIVFDGVCRLCNAWCRFIIRYDTARQFRLTPAQSPAGQAILRHFGRSTQHLDSLLYVADGEAYDKSEAVLRILSQLGWPWRLITLGRLCPRPVRDWLYDRIAANRYRLFGRYDTCTLAETDDRGRFIE